MDAPPPGDPFESLGLAPRFDLSPQQVERAYLQRVAALHPDAAGASADAAHQSAALNHARATLIEPEARANALLARLGGPSPSDAKSLPDGFLMDILEVREGVESDLRHDPDRAREKWGTWAEAERERYAAELSTMFAAAEPDRAAIRVTLNAWRYIERLVEQLDPDYDPGVADFDAPSGRG